VAMDLARILLRSPDELAATDISAAALARLRESSIREVLVLARRGPRQGAFAAKELEDIAELPGIDIIVDRRVVAADLARLGAHEGHERHKLEVLQALAERGDRGSERRLVIRFLASPVE